MTNYWHTTVFIDHDRLRVQLERLLLSWPLFRRNKIRQRISSDNHGPLGSDDFKSATYNVAKME